MERREGHCGLKGTACTEAREGKMWEQLSEEYPRFGLKGGLGNS